MGGKDGEGPPTSKGEGREEREDRGDGKREERNRDGTGSHFVTQRPSDPGIQRPGDPVDPVTPFYRPRSQDDTVSVIVLFTIVFGCVTDCNCNL